MRLKVEKPIEDVSEKWILGQNALYHFVAFFFFFNVLDLEVNRGMQALSYLTSDLDYIIYKGK